MSAPPVLDQNGVPINPDRPADNLFGSIFVTLMCGPIGIPFGIMALVNTFKVHRLFKAGDQQGARDASVMGEKWMYAAIGAAILMWIGYGIYWFLKIRK